MLSLLLRVSVVTIFEIIKLLEATSGLPVSAYVTSNEMVIRFIKPKGHSVKYTYTDEEIANTDINYWSCIGGAVKFKYKSER